MPERDDNQTQCTSAQYGGGINGATTCGCNECREYELQVLQEAGLA
jgi:hypothetical protein